jgi:hypothetical protein
MPGPGAILHYKGFRFEDGTAGDKYFIVLNKTEVDSDCLVLKTTSQEKRYGTVNQGCNPGEKVFYIPAGIANCFKLNTFVQLPQIIEISAGELLRGTLSRKNINEVDCLSEPHFKQLKDCLAKFRIDIAAKHWKSIF